MKKFYRYCKSFVIALICSVPFMTQAQLNVSSSASAQDLANAILGSGVSVSNVVLDCGPGGSGTFSNGGTTNIGLNDGILLTSGRASDAIGPNDDGGLTFNQPDAFNGDADLSTLVSGSIQDACRLEFDFVAESDFITVQYVFGSEEYNEYVCSQFNDVFGFFVTGNKPAGGSYNGENVALVPSTTLPVSVNTINNGSAGSQGNNSNCVSLLYSAYYQNNAGGLSIQYDGFTVVLTAEVAVIPGETYHFKFAIADVADSNLDSGVFIKGSSFSIFNCQAGILSLNEGSLANICSTDDIADVVSVSSNSTATGDEYSFLLTDVAGNILAINTTGTFDLSSFPNGDYIIYGISVDGIVSGIEIGENLIDITVAEDEGCYDLSNGVAIRKEACLTFELISCADDITLECGSNLEDYTITGSPNLLIENQGDAVVSLTHVDVISEVGDCGYIVTRTWIASIAGGPSVTCTQIITIEDTTGPVISGVEPVINVQCLEEVPAPVEASASDACTSVESLTTFTSQTGEVVSTCCLTTAFGPGADWAIWLPVLTQNSCCINSANWLFDGCGRLDVYADGTAHIYGTVYSSTNVNQKWDVSLWLENKSDWATWSGLGRNYKNDLALACATAGHIDWDYFTLVDGFSTLTGQGDLAGDVLYLSHMPANYYFGFQSGIGANNKNCNNGISGWFTYTGIVDGESVEGHGDINADAACEPVFDNDCVHNTSFTHFYRAVDACGNVTLISQSVVVEDTTAPTFDNCPESLTIECDQPVPAVAEGVTASDNCAGDVAVVFLGEEEEGNACYRTLTRTWSATDICGNRSDCIQTITIVDTTAPVLDGTPDAEITVECDAVPAAAQVTALDACQGVVEVGYYEEVVPGNCPGNYTLIRTWSAYDSCENGSSFSQTIHVQDTTAPVFDAYEFYTQMECDEIPALLTATDNCGEVVVEQISQQYLSGGCLGVLYRVFTATDACGNVTTAEQYISILDFTPPTLIGVPADSTIECSEVAIGEDGNYFDNSGVYGEDNCGYHFHNNCLLPVHVTYSEEVVATDDNCPQSFDIIRTWVAVDYCENESSATQTVHVVDTTAPSVYAPENTQFSCEEEVIFADASAEDNCGLATISEERDTIHFDCAQNFDIVRTFTAVDECGNVSEPATQIISVRDLTAPQFGEQQSQYAYECDETIPSIQPSATDNCSDVTYSSMDTLHYNSDCYSSFYRVWTATDACGNSSEFYQFIEIRDTTSPVISGVFEISRPCDDFMGTYVTAEDNCNEFEITFTDEHVSGSCAGKIIRRYVATDICENSSLEFTQFIILVDSINPVIVSETEDFTVECGDEYGVEAPMFSDNCDEELDIYDEVSSETDGCTTFITYTWTAVDHCNNSVTSSTVVTIVDTTDPYFTSFPENETISCEDEVPAVVYPTAADNCDENVDIELAIVEVPGSCPNERTINRTFRAYDNCGNEVVETQVITIVDETAPVFGEQNASFSYECNTEIPVVYPSASDNCGEVTLSYVDSLYLDSECLDIIIRTWTAVDECENSSNFVQSIQIVDTTAPVIAGEFEISRPCDDYLGIYVTATDNCNNLEITFYDEEVSGSCAGKVIRHYTATDLCENSSEEFLQYIILTDEVAPVIESETADFTVECGDEYGVEAPVFSDNCDDELVITSDVDSQFDGCTTTVTYSWTATDHCDNATTSITVVTIVDTTDPYFTSFPENMTISCEEELPAVVYPTAADNCDEQVEIELSIVEVPGTCPNERTINRTFRAIDNCGNDVEETQVITIIDETAPVFGEQQLEFTYECSEEIPVIEPSATDNCGEISYTHVDSELQSTIDAIEGYDGEGIYLDLTAYSGIVNLTITTSQESGIFHYINIPGVDYIAENAGTVTYPLEGGRIYGPCTAPNGTLYIGSETPVGGINLVIVEEGGDDWNDMVLTVDQGFFARYDFNPSTASICDKFFTRTWTASDECGNESVLVQTIYVVDTTAPVVDAYEIEISMPCDQISNQVLITATDNCNEVIITFEDEEVSGTCEGKIIRTYHVSDICGNVTEGVIQQIITLTDAVAPVAEVAPADVTVECGDETPAYTPVWNDNCANQEDLTLNYVSDVVFDGCTTTITEIWTATDNCNNTGSVTRVVTIVDTTDPEFTYVPASFTVECSEEYSLEDASASDICDEEVSIEVSVSEVAGDCAAEKVITRIFTATDNCGNSATAEQIITIVDTTAPFFTFVPANASESCTEFNGEAMATASDLCSDVIVTFSDVTTPYQSEGSSNDDCGQYTTYSVGGYGSGNGPQGAYLAANFASAFPNNLVIGCGNNKYTFTSAQAIVNFLPAGGPSSVLPAGNAINPTGVSNQIASQLVAASLSVGLDAANPNFSPAAGAMGNLIYANGTFAGMTVNQVIALANAHIGGCANTYSLNSLKDALELLNLNYDGGDQDNGNFVCSDEEPVCGVQIVRTWTATDACGNIANAVTTYIVYDNEAPEFDQELSDVTVECASEIPAPVAVTATDACGEATVSVEVQEEVSADDCGNQVLYVSYTATDNCGNVNTTGYFIYVNDTTDPVLDGCPSDLVLACEDEVPAPASVTATDNCDQDITVEYEQFVYGDLPAEGSIADCNLITPARPANNPCVYPYDWAMALFNLPAAHKYYSVSEGSLVQYPDGSIHITATMNNVITPSNGWLVDVWFQGGMDWATWSSQAFPTGFKADCGGIAANHPEWLYYILQASEGAELIGFGGYEGSSLNLVHAPANNYFGFQLGDGANNYNGADNAFGGWFSYSGLFLVNNQPFGMNQGNVSGGGDLAFELDCCPDYWIVRQWTATDCSGNSVTCSQTITFEGSEVVDGPSIVELPVQPELAENGIELSVYPNPAENMTTFKFKTAVTAKTTLELFDMAGAKVADVYNNRVEAGMDYQVDLDVRNLATGVYMFRFSNGENTDMGRLIISK